MNNLCFTFGEIWGEQLINLLQFLLPGVWFERFALLSYAFSMSRSDDRFCWALFQEIVFKGSFSPKMQSQALRNVGFSYGPLAPNLSFC
jgi:hypothetical protein